MRPSRRGSFAAAFALAGLLVLFPAAALASTNEPIAQTGGMSATLPLLGTTLSVDVTLDTVGNISAVTLTPSGGLTKTSSSDTLVRFATSDGSTKVSVWAKGRVMAIAARAPKLDDLLGSGTWSADVFGTGAKSSVPYTVGKDGSGDPTLAIGAVSAASGITATAGTPRTRTDGDDASASVQVSFARNGFVKRLTISVSTDKQDGDASLRIVLSGADRQKLMGTPAQLAGPRSWNAHLCDGTAVSVAYHVTASGTIAYDGATGATATEKSFGRGIWVRFDKQAVGVLITLVPKASGTYLLRVSGFSGFCGHKGDQRVGFGWGFGGSWFGSRTGDQTGDRTSSWGGSDSGWSR